MKLLKIFQILNLCFMCSLYSTPDLSIIGYVMPEDGLGKIPITIMETLGEKIDANFFQTDFKPIIKENLPPNILRVLNNPDKTPGKVALFTEGICSLSGNNYSHLPQESIIKIAYSMFETDRIPKMWVSALNSKFDAVVVPDSYYVKVYQNSGVKIPIFVLPIPMMLDNFFKYPLHQLHPYPFVFGDASANKNPAPLVKAFALAFGNNPNFCLVLRAGYISQQTRDEIEPIIKAHGLTNVMIEDQHYLLDQYIQRLSTFDCYVNLSCGEGFSLIPREALALGIPVIITNNTASTTICNSGLVRSVASNQKIKPRQNAYKIFFGNDCGDQFNCEVEDAKNALLDVYNNYPTYLLKAYEGRKWVDQYNCNNPQLKKLFHTLVKPSMVVLGSVNELENGVLTTDSEDLYLKYLQVISLKN